MTKIDNTWCGYLVTFLVILSMIGKSSSQSANSANNQVNEPHFVKALTPIKTNFGISPDCGKSRLIKDFTHAALKKRDWQIKKQAPIQCLLVIK
ncbi:hypothetical protein [Moraxella cuniculi]|uniref:hypothetical protein n=1 Tax=Moraxella cuniculi TaxID=34061 RepID=UPI000F825B89|nr:hypothetical protein [Moraxella cuniculi]